MRWFSSTSSPNRVPTAWSSAGQSSSWCRFPPGNRLNRSPNGLPSSSAAERSASRSGQGAVRRRAAAGRPMADHEADVRRTRRQTAPPAVRFAAHPERSVAHIVTLVPSANVLYLLRTRPRRTPRNDRCSPSEACRTIGCSPERRCWPVSRDRMKRGACSMPPIHRSCLPCHPRGRSTRGRALARPEQRRLHRRPGDRDRAEGPEIWASSKSCILPCMRLPIRTFQNAPPSCC